MREACPLEGLRGIHRKGGVEVKKPWEIEEFDLSGKTVEELNALLREDIFSEEDADFAWVDQVLEAIEAKEREAGGEIDVQGAKERFHERYSALEEPLYPEEDPEKARQEAEGAQGAGPGGRRKRNWLRGLVAAVLVSVLVAVPVAGQGGFMQLHSGWQTEDSQQIKGEIMEAQVGDEGEITIWYFVAGRGQVQALGAEEIAVWRQVNGLWLEAVRYDRNTLCLWAEGERSFEGTVVYRGQPGEYRIEMTVFVENESGYDTRSTSISLWVE